MGRYMSKALRAFKDRGLISRLATSSTHSTFTIINRSQRTCFAGVTILLSLTVFLNMVAETMPATSDAVPLLGKLVLTDLII